MGVLQKSLSAPTWHQELQYGNPPEPDYADTYNNMGTVYLNQGNNKRGCRDTQMACTLEYCELLEGAKDREFCH